MNALAWLRRNRVAAGVGGVGAAALAAVVLRSRADKAGAPATGRVASMPVYSSMATDVYDTIEPLVQQLTETANRIAQPPAQPVRAGDPDVQPTRMPPMVIGLPLPNAQVGSRYRPSPTASPPPPAGAPNFSRFLPGPGGVPPTMPGLIGITRRRRV